ncbi:MAG: LacI family DNA-binding transcriptional regulator [Thermoleophilaceae bacterium]|nr:LacI family DNA-binding transcriptional regulator [Thermoleophilaceae bacterium]
MTAKIDDGAPSAFRRPTINDVAALSGVSKSTVSNVMRGTGSVSAATRERVLEAIAALGYRPNATARNLVLRRTNLIGVVVGDLANAFDAELVKRIEQCASAHEYTTLVCNTGGHADLEASRIEALLEHRVDGIALLDFSGDRAVISKLLGERVPVVMVSCWSDYADCVAVDDMVGIELAVRHLVELGHERIAHVVDPLMEAGTRRARVAAFERALLRSGIAPRSEWTLVYDANETGGGSDLLALVARDDHPTAIVAANDYTAIRLIALLERNAIAVPRDISLVGFDGIDVSALSRIGLTTVAQPRDDLARTAVDLLRARIESGYDAPPAQHRLKPRLVVRGSTGPPR